LNTYKILGCPRIEVLETAVLDKELSPRKIFVVPELRYHVDEKARNSVQGIRSDIKKFAESKCFLGK